MFFISPPDARVTSGSTLRLTGATSVRIPRARWLYDVRRHIIMHKPNSLLGNLSWSLGIAICILRIQIRQACPTHCGETSWSTDICHRCSSLLGEDMISEHVFPSILSFFGIVQNLQANQPRSGIVPCA